MSSALPSAAWPPGESRTRPALSRTPEGAERLNRSHAVPACPYRQGQRPDSLTAAIERIAAGLPNDPRGRCREEFRHTEHTPSDQRHDLCILTQLGCPSKHRVIAVAKAVLPHGVGRRGLRVNPIERRPRIDVADLPLLG